MAATASNGVILGCVTFLVSRLLESGKKGTHTVRDAKTKYDACGTYVPCLSNGKLKADNIVGVNGECPYCSFDMVWSKDLHR